MSWVFELSKERPDIASNIKENRAVTAEIIKQDHISYMMRYPASVRVRNYVNITPRVTGRVTWVNKNFVAGGSFKKGEKLFQIDRDPFLVAVASAKARLMREQANYALIQADADIAKKEWNIMNSGQAIPDLVAKKPDLMRANANIAEAKANLRNAELNLSYTSFSVPFSGHIEKSQIEIGSFITVGANYGKLFKKDALEIIVQMPQAQAQNFDPKNFTAELLLNGEVYKAIVDRAPDILSADNRAREIILKPSENASAQVRAGQFLQARLISKEKQPLYKLRDDMLENGNILRIIEEDGVIKRQKVDILSSDNGLFYVPSLGRDLRIVTGTNSGLIDGMAVTIIGQE